MPDYVQIITCKLAPPNPLSFLREHGQLVEIARRLTFRSQGTIMESPAIFAILSRSKSSRGRKITPLNTHIRLCELCSHPSSQPSSRGTVQSNHQHATLRLLGTAQRPAMLAQTEVSGDGFPDRGYCLSAEYFLGTQWGHGGCGSALEGSRDVVSVVALTKDPCPLIVSIGEHSWTFQVGMNSPISYHEIPFDSTTVGPVRISLDGNTTEGAAIQNDCCHGQVSHPTLVLLGVSCCQLTY